jgi:Amt family ammonium transporter
VYSPIAHWVWGPDGFLAAANADAWVKVLDFAGGTVVHINSGVAGLMACLVLGKRKDTGPNHNMVLTFVGASLLWVGWFGFNAGSAVTAGMQAGMAMLVTQMATATAAFTWMLVEWMMRGKPTVVGMCTGAIAGLVAITPASGFVGPLGSLCIGIAAGILCYWGCTGLKHMLGYDDALDAFGVHRRPDRRQRDAGGQPDRGHCHRLRLRRRRVADHPQDHRHLHRTARQR